MMSAKTFRFVCLKHDMFKKAIRPTLSSLGTITWRILPPMSISGGGGSYPETLRRVTSAFDATNRKPKGRLITAAERSLLRLQYNGSRSFFEENPDAIAVAWSGLGARRRVFMDGARDAGARTLYFEHSPFAGRITVDPQGVNNANSLPREIEPYIAWAQASGIPNDWNDIRDTIQARKPVMLRKGPTAQRPLTEPFIFVPLQVPGDSQLRLFGGSFRTVEATIEATVTAAKALPDGWHLRLKEHPSSRIHLGDLIAQYANPRIVLDNATDTFTQVDASRAVITVNSSVGLEAMFFEKPVIALGECFWAIPGVATPCPTMEGLVNLLKDPAALSFELAAREAFLSFLTNVYYPRLPSDGQDMEPSEVEKVRVRIGGSNSLFSWPCPVE